MSATPKVIDFTHAHPHGLTVEQMAVWHAQTSRWEQGLPSKVRNGAVYDRLVALAKE